METTIISALMFCSIFSHSDESTRTIADSLIAVMPIAFAYLRRRPINEGAPSDDS